MPQQTLESAGFRQAMAPEAVFSAEQLMQRCMGKLEFAEKILDLFMAKLDGDVQELEAAMTHEESDRVAQLAHRIRGSSASVAAIRFQRLMSIVEQAGKDGNLSEIQNFPQVVDAEVTMLKQAIASWRSQKARTAPLGDVSSTPRTQREWRSVL